MNLEFVPNNRYLSNLHLPKMMKTKTITKNLCRISHLLISFSLLWAIPAISNDAGLHDKNEAEQSQLPAHAFLISFKSFAENEQDEKLMSLLEESSTLDSIVRFIEANFIIDTPVRFHIQHSKQAQLIATEIQENSHIINLPFSFLHTLYQGLSNKYALQSDVIDQIFLATFEFYVWSEFGDYLITDKQLEVSGDIFTAKDNLATLLVLNKNTHSSDFLPDASEAYLLINNSQTASINQYTKSELELDQRRYRHIICLTLGFNEATQSPEIEEDSLSSLAWDKSGIARCRSTYHAIVENWYQALKPYLKSDNRFSHWRNQVDLSDTPKPRISPSS